MSEERVTVELTREEWKLVDHALWMLIGSDDQSEAELTPIRAKLRAALDQDGAER